MSRPPATTTRDTPSVIRRLGPVSPPNSTRRGDAAGGPGPYEQALQTFEPLGAARDVGRVTAAMRAAGLRRGARGARMRPASGWESLTPAEVRVARLVSQGLTNPEIAEQLFISRATVKTHLIHIFSKLDVPNRRALAAEESRHQAERPPAAV